MRKIINAAFAASLMLTSFFANGQEMLTAQGQRYNEKDFSQEFVYDLSVDSTNTIVGTIIQENKSPDKEWCAYLKVTAIDKDKKAVAVFTTAPHKLEAQGKANNGRTFKQNVKWKLKEKNVGLLIECVTSCTPFKEE